MVSQPESRANHGDGGFAWSSDGETLFLSSNANREFAAVVAYDVGGARFDSLVESEFDLADVRLCGADDAYLLWTENRDGFDVLGGATSLPESQSYSQRFLKAFTRSVVRRLIARSLLG